MGGQKVLENPSPSSASTSSGVRRRVVTTSRAGARENSDSDSDSEPAEKISKNDQSSNPHEVQVLVQDIEIRLDDLPPKLLNKILGNVDTQTLLLFRLASRSRKLNDLSCLILCSRPQAKFEFFVSNSEFLVCTKTEVKSLQDFLACFSLSKNVPFAHFSVFFMDDPVESNYLDSGEWITFLRQFKESKIKCLKLFINCSANLDSLRILAQKLGDLLLYDGKNFREFGLELIHSPPDGDGAEIDPNTSEIKLFSDSSSSSIRRPVLEVLHLGNSLLKNHPGIAKDLLSAAVNLERIQIISPNDEDEIFVLHASTYQLLRSEGKLDCLEEIQVQLNAEFLNAIKNQCQYQAIGVSPSGLDFKLKKLKLIVNDSLDDAAWESELEGEKLITRLIFDILRSSKNTLESLTLEPLGFFKKIQFQFPCCAKANRPEIPVQNPFRRRVDSSPFSPSVSRNTFAPVELMDMRILEECLSPASLGLNLSKEDPILRLPRLNNLILVDSQLEEIDIANVALMCINLKKLKITRKEGETPKINFLQMIRAIWTHLKKLETLEIDVDVDSLSVENQPATCILDSCFTGISEENCQRLVDMKKADKLMKKWGSEGWIPEQELIVDREYPSILDMKDLKKFTVNLYSGGKLLDDKKELFPYLLTWISQGCAFNLMPNLKINQDINK